MNKIKLTALPCICVDVFDGIEMIRPGGEALNFAVHASRFTNIDVTLLGVIGKDKYAEVIMDSIAKFAIDKKHIRIDERHQTANNMTYLIRIRCGICSFLGLVSFTGNRTEKNTWL